MPIFTSVADLKRKSLSQIQPYQPVDLFNGNFALTAW
jgi:hypothetical protein